MPASDRSVSGTLPYLYRLCPNLPTHTNAHRGSAMGVVIRLTSGLLDRESRVGTFLGVMEGEDNIVGGDALRRQACGKSFGCSVNSHRTMIQRDSRSLVGIPRRHITTARPQWPHRVVCVKLRRQPKLISGRCGLPSIIVQQGFVNGVPRLAGHAPIV